MRSPELLIHLTKRADGSTVLRCVRADGSASWQRHDGRQGIFFPLHDLTHFAVESELGLRSGFYGLVARGWDIEDTTGKGTRGALPPEALVVEHLVGVLDLERAGSVVWTAPELNAQAVAYTATRGLPPPPSLTDDDLSRIRARARALLEQWDALEAGGTLELSFP